MLFLFSTVNDYWIYKRFIGRLWLLKIRYNYNIDLVGNRTIGIISLQIEANKQIFETAYLTGLENLSCKTGWGVQHGLVFQLVKEFGYSKQSLTVSVWCYFDLGYIVSTKCKNYFIIIPPFYKKITQNRLAKWL
jgi:hypothetical protein